MLKVIAKKALPAVVLVVAVLVSVALYRLVAKPPVFLSASSPGGTYVVNLSGQKGRPLFFTNEVRFEVLKNGEPFIPSSSLHSGDSFDLSFESGYPNHRWTGENVLQFYREQHFNAGQPDTLIVVNQSGQPIKYLRVQSVDKLLFFDLPRGAEVTVPMSRHRGDSSGVYVEGEFDGGRDFKGGAAFTIHKEQNGPFTYYIRVIDDGVRIENPHVEKYKST